MEFNPFFITAALCGAVAFVFLCGSLAWPKGEWVLASFVFGLSCFLLVVLASMAWAIAHIQIVP